jgi:hypothetical protein
VSNDLAYVRILLRVDESRALASALELVEVDSSYLVYRITAGLGYLRAGDPDAALALFRGLRLAIADIQPWQRVIIAAIFEANGRKEQAKALLTNVDPNDLLPEELELYRDAET